MKCSRCGSGLKDDWNFCPKCGSRKSGDPYDAMGRDLFSEMFGRMRSSFRDVDEINRRFEKNFEAVDLSPWFRGADSKVLKPQGKGFTVRIVSQTGQQPKVSIKTYGDVDRGRIEKEVEKKFGVAGTPPAEAKKPGGGFRMPVITGKPEPRVTEEPHADIKRIGDKVVVEVNVPGVKSPQDIEIREMESSLEVKARAGDKAYFKILTKPPKFRVTGRSFRDGVLRLEFS